MPYLLRLEVEDEDTGEVVIAWGINNFDSEEDALCEAEELLEREYSHSGIEYWEIEE